MKSVRHNLGCCKLFQPIKASEYEPITGSSETTLSKTVVVDSQKPFLKGNGKVSQQSDKLRVGMEAEEDFHFEQDILFQQVLPHAVIEYGAIVCYPGGNVKAANFPVKKKGIKNIVLAFQGNSEPLAHYGIKLSSNLPSYSPGKMEKDKAIYGTIIPSEGTQQGEQSDSQSGGCTIMKSKDYILIITYKDSDKFDLVEQISSGVIKQLLADGK